MGADLVNLNILGCLYANMKNLVAYIVIIIILVTYF